MIWCRFQVAEKPVYGLVEGDQVVEVKGSPFEQYEPTGVRHPLGSAKLLAPCVPPTFYAVGHNYLDHVKWAAQYFNRNLEAPKKPDINYRASNALTGHEDPIIIPRESSGEVHHGGELVAVIGKKGKHLSRDEALSCVLGYTIGNDISDRTWQQEDRTMWRVKNTDTFKPMGPWIVTDVDPTRSTTMVRINGEEVLRFDTGKMIFDVAAYISEMSKNLTLHPGDVIWMGADGPTVPALRPGDTVEIEISGIGTLRNPVIAEA